MYFSVRVYCDHCHREGILDLVKSVGEDTVRKIGECPNCMKVGKLMFASSIGRKV